MTVIEQKNVIAVRLSDMNAPGLVCWHAGMLVLLIAGIEIAH